MIEFTQEFKEKIKRRMDYNREHINELKPTTMTIKIEKKNNMLTRATRTGDDYVWYTNDSKEEIEGKRGTSPLSYFLSSLGLCQCVHYAEHTIVDNLKLESLAMRLDAIVSQNPREFTDITYSVYIESKEDEQKIKNLALKAANDCYVTNTIKKACKVTGIIYYNGKKIDEHN